MDIIQWLVTFYLSVGFAKFVLDISRLPFIYAVIMSIEAIIFESEGHFIFRAKLLFAFTMGLSIQAWLVWPEILLNGGFLSFIQPISRERAAEIVGAPFGLRLDAGDD